MCMQSFCLSMNKQCNTIQRYKHYIRQNVVSQLNFPQPTHSHVFRLPPTNCQLNEPHVRGGCPVGPRFVLHPDSSCLIHLNPVFLPCFDLVDFDRNCHRSAMPVDSLPKTLSSRWTTPNPRLPVWVDVRDRLKRENIKAALNLENWNPRCDF